MATYKKFKKSGYSFEDYLEIDLWNTIDTVEDGDVLNFIEALTLINEIINPSIEEVIPHLL